MLHNIIFYRGIDLKDKGQIKNSTLKGYTTQSQHQPSQGGKPITLAGAASGGGPYNPARHIPKVSTQNTNPACDLRSVLMVDQIS